MNKLGGANFALVERNFRKMIRKILVLALDKVPSSGSQQPGFGVSHRGRSKKNINNVSVVPTLSLAETLPTHVHLVAIMGERTQLEKQTFGKLSFEHGQTLTEDKVDWAIQKFIEM